MRPNLERIPADGDERAAQIVHQAVAGDMREVLDTLPGHDVLILGRYGARHPTIALRNASTAQLVDALLATAIGQVRRGSESRDAMVSLAVHHFVARQLGDDPAAIFAAVAALLPDGPVPDLLREFGVRHDVTLEAFGWQQVLTPDGPDFAPAPTPAPGH